MATALHTVHIRCRLHGETTNNSTRVFYYDRPETVDLPGKTIESPGSQALAVARKMLGSPYRYGGTDPKGFDCSGLVRYAFSQSGVELPRTSKEMFRASLRIDPQKIEPGDLVFFTLSANKISHVGIYAGQSRFIHSPSSGKGVSYASMANPYWQRRLIAAGRF